MKKIIASLRDALDCLCILGAGMVWYVLSEFEDALIR